MMAERSGTTAEGTTWRTRPMSPEIEARYACIHRGGIVPCETIDDKCRPQQTGWHAVEWIAPKGAKVRPYSPATPKGMPSMGLPADVGADFAEAVAVARVRLSLMSWPTVKDVAPKLSKLAKADATVTRTHKAFMVAVRAALAPGAEWRNAW